MPAEFTQPGARLLARALTQDPLRLEAEVVDVLGPALCGVVVPPGVAHDVALLDVVAQVEAEVEVVLGTAAERVLPEVVVDRVAELGGLLETEV